MKQILTLTVTAFQEKFYVAYMLFVLNLIKEFEVMSEMFEYYVNQFNAAYKHLNFVYLKYDVKFYTEKVQDADKARTKAYRSLKDRISYLHMFSDNDEIVETARILLEVINLYGNAVKMKVGERTAVLENLIEDFEDKYPEQVTAIGVGELLAALRTEQEKYMDAYMKRNEADSQYALNAMAEARKLLTEAYRDLVEAVNLAAKRDEEGVLTSFINRINSEIRKNFTHTGQRPSSAGGGASAGGGNGTTDEGGTTMKAAIFKFVNGNEVRLLFVPGEPIVAPENTPGYRWDPAIPEAMPKRSKTFKEVAIDPEKFTALFHFADHREEEIREVAGAILHAPENTTGYIWVPSVPETMPAEDTVYNEMPEEEQVGDEHDGMFKAEYFVGENLVATQWYHPGDRIVEPEGLLPDGWIWGNTPNVMPERDVKIYAVEDE